MAATANLSHAGGELKAANNAGQTGLYVHYLRSRSGSVLSRGLTALHYIALHRKS